MEIPLGQAWENLKNMVFTGDFRIQVNLSGNVIFIIIIILEFRNLHSF